MGTINKELEVAKNRLLDLTIGHQFLNIHPSKVSAMRVLDEIQTKIFNCFFLHKKKLVRQTKSKDQKYESLPEGIVDTNKILHQHNNIKEDLV